MDIITIIFSLFSKVTLKPVEAAEQKSLLPWRIIDFSNVTRKKIAKELITMLSTLKGRGRVLKLFSNPRSNFKSYRKKKKPYSHTHTHTHSYQWSQGERSVVTRKPHSHTHTHTFISMVTGGKVGCYQETTLSHTHTHSYQWSQGER